MTTYLTPNFFNIKFKMISQEFVKKPFKNNELILIHSILKHIIL